MQSQRFAQEDAPAATYEAYRYFPVSLACGLALGTLTLGGQAVLPNSVQQVSNSGAVWVIIAFVIGQFGRSWRSAAIAGFVALVGEVLGYYGAALIVIPGDANPISYMTMIGMWSIAALVAGPIVGSAGYFARYGAGRGQAVASGVLGGVFIGEGAYLITQLGTWQTGVAWLVIAFIITLIIAWKNPTRLQSLLATAFIGLMFFGGELVLLWVDTLRGSSF